MKNYDDIINLPHHTSKYRPRMPAYKRAAQFIGFRALRGLDAELEKVRRITTKRLEISEEASEDLNNKLKIILENIDLKPTVTFTYFKQDEGKDVGEYLKVTGNVTKLDLQRRTVVFDDKTSIPIDEISEIESKIFNE